MKEKQLKVIKKLCEIVMIIVFVASIILALYHFFSINAFAAGPGGSGDTSGGFGSDDVTSSTTESFVPPQIPSVEEYVQYFGYPLVFNQRQEVYNFFEDPTINIEALLSMDDRGYIVSQIRYRTDLSGLSYTIEVDYLSFDNDGIDTTSTLYLNSTDRFLLYVFKVDAELLTPDDTAFFETYFYNMILDAYIGFTNYFENVAIPQYEIYYNNVLNKLGSTQYGQNMLLSIITAPYNVLDSFTLFEANGVNISLWNVLITCIGIALFIWFIKMFAGG